MRTSWRTFALAALVGSGLFLLAQTPASAQFRRPIVRPPVVLPLAPRAPLAPALPYSNPYLNPYTNPLALQQSLAIQQGIALNRAATYNALATNRLLMLQYQLYNPYYTPVGLNPLTTAYPYVTPNLLYLNSVISPGLPYNPNNAYNPYFAAFGFRP